MPVQENEDKRTPEPILADEEELRRQQMQTQQEHETSFQKSGKLLPFLNAKAEHHQSRIDTLDGKIATQQDKIKKHYAKIEKLGAKADRLEDHNKMLKATLGDLPLVQKLIAANEKRIDEIRNDRMQRITGTRALSRSAFRIKDIDAPNFGGILLGTSDVLAYDGWQDDMNAKGFEIISKAAATKEILTLSDLVNEFFESSDMTSRTVDGEWRISSGGYDLVAEIYQNEVPVCGIINDIGGYEIQSYNSDMSVIQAVADVLSNRGIEITKSPLTTEQNKDLGPVTIRIAGDYCEMRDENARIAEEVLGLTAVDGVVRFSASEKSEYAEKLSDAGYFVMNEEVFELNPPKRDVPEKNADALDRAINLINDFCVDEYSSEADFSDLSHVAIAYTTDPDTWLEVQVYADLEKFRMITEYDGKTVREEQYDSLEAMVDQALTNLDFNELVYIEDDGKEPVEKTVPTVKTSEDSHSDAESISEQDDDVPLFTDAEVISEIQKNENSSDNRPFWEQPTLEGEQLSLFGDSVPIEPKKSQKQKPEFATGPVVDGVQVYNALTVEIDRGTGFVDGKLRVQEFYDEQHPTTEELAKFLKKAYGIGGHSGEGNISLVSTDSKGMTFDFRNGEKFRHSWYNVATMTEARLRDNTYLSAEQQEKYAKMRAEKAAESTLTPVESKSDESNIVTVGDKFRDRKTGEISEIISFSGALPWYEDQCTVQRESHDFIITENMSVDKLFDDKLYEYLGKGEVPEKSEVSEKTAEQVAPEKKAPVTVDAKQTAEMPKPKNLSQLKKALQVGMEFEILDHHKRERIGERRVVTGKNTANFTSKRLDENNQPYGDDIYMDWEKAGNWQFGSDKITVFMDTDKENILLSFRFIDGKEHEKSEPEKTAEVSVPETKEPVPVYTGEWKISDNKALFREIVAENERFAKMANDVIGNGKNPADSVKALVDEFGMERTAFLTALNIVSHPMDGRFYPADKEWACKVLAPYLDVKPDENIHRDPEKERLFSYMIGGAPLHSIHNTHLAQFAETLIPEYEKYLELSHNAEKSEPELSVGDFIEYKGKEYKVESLDPDGFITLNAPMLDGKVQDRVTFITEEFLNNAEFKLIEPKTEDVPDKGDSFTITDDSLGSGGAKEKFRNNIAAIKMLKMLEKEHLPAYPEAKEVLSKYVGWGGLASAFDKNASSWAAEYAELKELLTPQEYRQAQASTLAKGIPAEEIAFIHDAKTEQQKSELFDKVRSGEIRVLLGSTAKMGTGTNVQKKLIAVHDLDIPWRPADLDQRAGRIIRQGNENKNVQIFRYVTKGTFDAYSYQTLENKQKFISQIMTSKTPARKCDDVDQQALTYSEIKALCTGDERIKEKLMLENDVKELRVLSAEHRNTVFEMEDRISAFPEQEKKLMTILDNLRTDRQALRKLPIDPERKLPVFKITIGDTEYTDRKEAAKALEDAVLAIKYADTPVKVGSFQGFDLKITMNSAMMGGGTTATLEGAASHTTKLIESFAHNLNRLESALYNIDGRIERTQANLVKLRLDHDEAQKIVAEPFPQQAELDSKEERLKELTDELNQAAIEAKKNAPKREKTCYFERAKMKRDAMKLAKKPKTPKDKAKSKDKGIE